MVVVVMEQVQGGWEGGGVMSEKRCLVSSLDYLSGVSRISARGVLKVRPHTKSGGGGGGGGEGGRFRSDIRKVGGAIPLQVRYL